MDKKQPKFKIGEKILWDAWYLNKMQEGIIIEIIEENGVFYYNLGDGKIPEERIYKFNQH